MTHDQAAIFPRLSPDDLVGLAHAAWRHGLRHCGDCGGYHMIWGSMRAAGLHRGLVADEPFLVPRLLTALSPGARVFIAGSADPAVLDLVARSAVGMPLTILVADLCRTPLAVIDELEPYPDMEVRTETIDLRDLDHVARWDLIISHSMLPHVPPGDRLQVLRGLRRALAPNGKLIFVVRTFHSVVEGQVEDEQAIWAQQTLAHISASGISLPAPILEFKAQIQRNAARRRKVAWELASPEEIADLLTAGGFRVTDYARMADRKHKTAYNQARAKGSYVFVAD